MSKRLIALAMITAAVSIWPACGAAQAAVRCPIKASTANSGQVQWAFSDSSVPSGSNGIRSAYTHGRGTWMNGQGGGNVCEQATLRSGPSVNVVLRVYGAARLSVGVRRFGLLGVALKLPVQVTASDDPTCTMRTHGTLSLFASYHEIHRDSVRLSLRSGCSTHNLHFADQSLRVLIARGGRQVN